MLLRMLGRRSIDLYDDFISRLRTDSGHAIVYQRNGTFDLAFSDDDVDRLGELAKALERDRIEAHWVMASAFDEYEPLASKQARGALFIPNHGFVGVTSRVTSHREFLLRPDLGRRLADGSLAELRARCRRGADVQIIVADGLSAVACMQTGKRLHDAVAAACAARGLSVGTPVAARFARVWLEDEIGQETQARVAMILLGERPGLGTGDGLSAYLVHAPRIGKTDSDRNMISNIHARGMPPEQAAERLAALADAMIEQKTSGVALDLAALGDTSSGGRGYRAPLVRQRLVGG